LDGHESYEVMASRTLPGGMLGEIERDVGRTLPTHPRFHGEEGQGGRKELLKILRAVAAAEPIVGYCQGMNFVAAVLLISLGSDQDAFWMLLSMMEGYHYRNIFAPGVPLLPLRVFQFTGLVRKRLPRLWRHMESQGFSLDIFAHQCVMTLFAYSIEPAFLAHVWDSFFLLGWKAVFRIGLGILATLQPRLLEMDIEKISTYMHQCKRHVDPGTGEGGSKVQSTLLNLLRFKVPCETLDDLQRAFRLERLEALLLHRSCQDGESRRGDPLPLGFEWSKCGTNIQLHPKAFSTQDLPPWRQSAENSPVVGDDESTASAHVLVPLGALGDLRAALIDFDGQTHQDVTSLSHRVGGTERQLTGLLNQTEALRGEVQECALERDERQEFKKALMEVLQVAVKTSVAPPQQVSMEDAGGSEKQTAAVMPKPPPVSDVLVRQCLGRLKDVESDFFDRSVQWRTKSQALEPVEEEIAELRETKARSMEQLSSFLDMRAEKRQDLLEAGLQRFLAGGEVMALQ